ncbi:MAG: recombination mediator RecR [Paracoccaceae bacterium]|jgi:recombination protein RecR|nr:recombination protein RecR [Paracoccaceae bacterium]MDG1880343.1 recombination mediator RecR [Paracoccaceae bacterium]MDG1939916.1 recombination mediator RecR [Paracoccaceae bacterium]|tara:strand:- start:2624 stop:3226 length:603 start_codon:yes stop_codon:yes gene_type:complete
MSLNNDNEIERLISLMAKLPGMGPRSARRAVLHLIRKKSVLLNPLSEALKNVSKNVRECLNCGNIGAAEYCDLCLDDKRNNGQICVVEGIADLWAMERSRIFKGRYHVLGGVLSALDGIGPENLGIKKLKLRLASENINEVILALNSTIDGQTTAHYIADELDNSGIQITSLAQGVPIGGELDYLDDGTISAALNARKSF